MNLLDLSISRRYGCGEGWLLRETEGGGGGGAAEPLEPREN